MRPEILFIHSAGPHGFRQGSDYLISYLRNTLTDHAIRCPVMPDPENPRYSSWKNVLKKELVQSQEGVILIGHSMGASILLKYLSEERIQKQIGALFLIGCVYWGKENWEVEEFALHQDFAMLLPVIPAIHFYHSKDDSVVSVSHMDEFARVLPLAGVHKLDDRGHLFSRGLPELVCDIRNLTSCIEVFSTNVSTSDHAHFLAHEIQIKFSCHEVNFDLEDCDRVLRVKADEIDVPGLVGFLDKHGVTARPLE